MTKDAMASGSAIFGRGRQKVVMCVNRGEAVLTAGKDGRVNGIVTRR